jgi:GntR family transcriptional regulator of arabinose operon
MDALDKQSSKAIYQQLATIIRKQVLYGEIKPGDKLPSEYELVKLYQISRSSVRQGLDILVAEGLVERVHGKGNFISYWRSTNNEGGTIGLLVPYERFSLFPNIISGIETAAKDRGFTLTINYMGNNDREEKETVKRLINQKIAGFVVYPRNNIAYDEMIWQMYEERFPFVLVDRYFNELACSYVGVDNLSAVYNLVSYLISLGHREIGFIAPKDANTTSIRERYAGYRNALRHNGIEFNEDWLCWSPSTLYSPIHPDQGEENEINFFREYFRNQKLPTALIAVNDYTAYLIFNAAKAEGLEIPADLTLVGFDNDEFARFNEVPLTTVEQPYREVGARAANMLIDMIKGISSTVNRILLPTRLIVRQSSGGLPRRAFEPSVSL